MCGEAIANHNPAEGSPSSSIAAAAERLSPCRNNVTTGVTMTQSQPRLPTGLPPSAFPVGAPVSSTSATDCWRATSSSSHAGCSRVRSAAYTWWRRHSRPQAIGTAADLHSQKLIQKLLGLAETKGARTTAAPAPIRDGPDGRPACGHSLYVVRGARSPKGYCAAVPEHITGGRVGRVARASAVSLPQAGYFRANAVSWPQTALDPPAEPCPGSWWRVLANTG